MKYKCLLRSTMNKESATGNRLIKLHKDIMDDMDWKINDILVVDIVKNGLKKSIVISREEKE